ncbi:hypothetical protein HPG69_019056 [Diceros bicornis minor]|uniref:HSR domain-containing protein n=1 Tax=Diceros bicornis minor TaxID=77932 RepID=A0A7J7EJL9_DICBM|nr:hypothetical protein HPG69_019056 [Diceros bicornis minor]
MFPGDQNPEDPNSEEQFFYDLIFRLFKENKVEIASAITKPFPLLMGLRDRGFIPEQINLVPVERVVYDVLSELEKTFDKSVLDALFSKVNLRAYPDLLEICRSFQNVQSCAKLLLQTKNGEVTREAQHILVQWGMGQHVKATKCERNGGTAE